MKLKENFITHETDGEQIMVDAGGSDFVGLVRSNATAAFIVDSLKTDTTKKAIVDAMCARYDASREIIDADVEEILAKLRSIGALDE